jgi:uncharacterized membrane protein SpoIIM required for sporulation
MVLELLINISKLRHRPIYIFIEAIFLTIISIIISFALFPENYTSIAILGFLTIGALPLFNNLYAYDSYLFNYNKSFFNRHKRIITLLFYFFLGVLITFIFAYFLFPSNISKEMLGAQFGEIDNISDIKASITGQTTGHNINSNNFWNVFNLIFKNNILVMITATLLSFFYGAGGLFLIVWNASILSAVLIRYILSAVSFAAGQGLWTPFIAIYHGFVAFLGFIPHGFFEVLAYFFVSVAGAMLARDLFKGVFTTDFKWFAIRDFFYMFLLAVFSLVIGAIIESLSFII